MANKATITTEDRRGWDSDTKHANHLIRKAARIVQPRGAKYAGSAVIHYFTVPSDASKLAVEQTHNYQFGIQILFDHAVDEGFADLGWKMLKEKFMAFFGRKAPATRTPGGIYVP